MPKSHASGTPPVGRSRRTSSNRVPKRWLLFAIASGPILIGTLLASLLVTPTLLATIGLAKGTTWLSSQAVELDYNEPLPQQSQLLDANGTAYATLFAEHRVPVKYDEIPEVVINALVATEDSRFWQHNGVDWIAITRVAVSNFTQGSIEGGGSGITQQYVKNLLLSQAVTDEQRQAATEVSIRRKIREAATALDLEKHLTKQQIITGYLNTVYFGDRAYGIGAAALHFFNKKPADLTLDEAALLIGQIQSPERFNPARNPKDASARRSHVLDRMVVEKFISKPEALAAAKTPIKLSITNTPNGCGVSEYPLYCEYVRRTILENPVFGKTPEARERLLYKGGLTIRTSLIPEAVKSAEQALRDALPANGNLANAIAVVEPGTGRVAAIAMNRKFGSKPGETEILLPVVPAFQSGSTFKVITAVAALESGWNPDAYMYAPAKYKDIENVGGSAGGNLNLPGAVYRSVNTWFIMLEEKVGIRKTAQMAVDMGMVSVPLSGSKAVTDKAPLTLTIGTIETSPLEVATVYASIASGGIACNPIAITSMVRIGGEKINIPDADCKRVMRQSTADTMINILRYNVKQGTGTRAQLPDSRPTAGKTGTTDNAGAIWFAGFTTQYAAAVWFGDPRSAQKYPIGNSLTAFGQYWSAFGGGAPAETWKRAMTRLHENLPIGAFPPPGGDSYVGVTTIVPDVRGLTPALAKQTLEQSGFEVQVVSNGKKLEGLPSGLIVEQSLSPGTNLFSALLPLITITVGK